MLLSTQVLDQVEERRQIARAAMFTAKQEQKGKALITMVVHSTQKSPMCSVLCIRNTNKLLNNLYTYIAVVT